ncbi:MAG TPA: HAD-IG family 5'-nucleotidase [Thermoanaerobaculia bacterium]|nr:HAD-IG family 5'-nucleotidase [Thermoanaerobaculia bacterium]
MADVSTLAQSFIPDAATDKSILELLGKEVPLERRIFVNRNLRLGNIEHVGFDLDWTLADYARLPLGNLTFEAVLDRLVGKYGYPPAVRKAEFRPDFYHRGLLIDKQIGTVLKMDRHRYVGRAYLGRTHLTPDDRKRIYREKRIDLSRERFYHVDTLFELPEVNLFSEFVELLQTGQLGTWQPTFQEVFTAIRAATDEVHADGTLKRVILSDLPRFIPDKHEVGLTLRKMKREGRRLILITNSEWYYTNAVCSYLFGDGAGSPPGAPAEAAGSWRDIFDLVVVSAAKPLFFQKPRPFLELDDQGEVAGEVLTPAWGGIYSGGSRDGLMALLGTLGEKILYIGDHIYGDIRWTRVSSTWRTALIVSELEEELQTRETLLTDLNEARSLAAFGYELESRLGRLNEMIAIVSAGGGNTEELRTQRAELVRRLRRLQREARSRQDRLAAAFNPTWGSVFRQGTSKSLFAEEVEDYACLYTSRLSNFLYYGADQYFRVLSDPMMHDNFIQRPSDPGLPPSQPMKTADSPGRKLQPT